jgi:hypothetical protein
MIVLGKTMDASGEWMKCGYVQLPQHLQALTHSPDLALLDEKARCNGQRLQHIHLRQAVSLSSACVDG